MCPTHGLPRWHSLCVSLLSEGVRCVENVIRTLNWVTCEVGRVIDSGEFLGFIRVWVKWEEGGIGAQVKLNGN